jgi:hypothetical protein
MGILRCNCGSLFHSARMVRFFDAALHNIAILMMLLSLPYWHVSFSGSHSFPHITENALHDVCVMMFLLSLIRHNWEKLPPSYSYSLLIFFNLLIILLSTLILHVGFFGRLITLYRRNYERVACLTSLGEDLGVAKMDSWWNCRCLIHLLRACFQLISHIVR